MSPIEQLRLCGQLPSPKGIALAIMEISQREDATVDEVAKLVQSDPALSCRLLRMCNAALTGRRPTVAINEAVMRLGITTVRRLAVTFSLVDQSLLGPCPAFDYPRFWSHSLFMAVASQELGRLLSVASPDELFTCGLLAQIGCLALATAYPTDYAELLTRAQDSNGIVEVSLERSHLGLDHRQLTAAIMADCGIPKALVEPVSYHEQPETADFVEGSRPYQLVHLFYQARRTADLGLALVGQRHGRLSDVMRLGGKIGLDATALGELFDGVVCQWRDWAELLKVPASHLPTFAEMASAPLPSGEKGTGSCHPVLLVEDDVTTRTLTEEVLSRYLGCKVYTAENGKEALAIALQITPKVVVTDWLMPEMDGLDFCRALRATDWGQSIYVIMLTAVDQEEQIIAAFQAGVDDYVTKPVNPRALTARMCAAQRYTRVLAAWENDRVQIEQFAAELAITNRRLEHAALTDLLTDLPNRRAGMAALARYWSASRRTGQPMAVLMIDVDHFKAINDRHGHAIGDRVLQEVAKAIQNAARKDDSVSRIGGEEFMLVCHDADPRVALLAAERLRRLVKATQINLAGVAIQVSLSFGVAVREAAMSSEEDLLKGADKALYAAKHAGRDRVSLFTQGRTHCA